MSKMNKALKAAYNAILRVRVLEVLERDATRPFRHIAEDGRFTYRPCLATDLERFKALGPQWLTLRGYFERRLAREQICIGCFDGDDGVGYMWITAVPETDTTLGLHVCPSPDQLYGFDLFVAPEYRRFGIGYGLISSWLQCARTLGRPRALGIVLNTNFPMLMLKRAGFGFRTVHRVTSVQILRRFGVIVRGRRPDLC